MNFDIKKGRFNTIDELIKSIDTLHRKQSTLIIGIDGCGGSGKSTLAQKIQEQYSNTTIVHMDDFHLPSNQIIDKEPMKKALGADFDWKRMLSQVLEPISNDNEGYYQRYDWDSDSLAEWHIVPTGNIVIIEGVYSTRQELEDKYDITIWVDCPRGIRLERGLERDGEDARDIWENNWMISEKIYLEKQKPHERADIIVNGSGNLI